MRKSAEVCLPPKLFSNRILRVNEVATMLSYSTWHIYRLVNQNKIPFYKKGKTLFFMEDEILDWLKGAA